MISASYSYASNFNPVEINNADDLVKVITTMNYSTAIFRDNYRDYEHFIQSEYLAFDVDNGWKIEDAKEALKDYWHIIAPSQNHQKIKKPGKPDEQAACDRFRIILKLSYTITDAKWHKSTWLYVNSNLIKNCDEPVKDAVRMFFPSSSVYSINESGRLIDPVEPSVKEVQAVEVDTKTKGKLSYKTLEFLQNGAKPGMRNSTVYVVATDMRDQGYQQSEATSLIFDTAKRLNIWDESENAEFEQAISNAYGATPGYNKRVQTYSGLNLETMAEVINHKENLSWLITDLLTQGGLSLIVGLPKTGKSTIVRQIARSVCRGEEFLTRPVKKGKVLYLAIEEQRAMLKAQLQKTGIHANDDILIHIGPIQAADRLQVLSEAILDIKPSLVVIDTIMLLLDIEDINNYSQVNPAFSKLRNIARDTNTHIMGVHHQNKGMARGTTSVMGSVGIHGAVDTLMLFDVIDGHRYLTTSQRGGVPFLSRKLKYVSEQDTYHL